MKPLIQKLPLSENCSFVCRTYRTPYFETPWHQHIEHELLLITEGHGHAIVGDYLGEYGPGDVFFLGANLPHWFRKADAALTGSAVVVHFEPEFLGSDLLRLPEMRKVVALFHASNGGLQLRGTLRSRVGAWLKKMEASPGVTSLWLLLRCLDEMDRSAEFGRLTTSATRHEPLRDRDPIARVFEFTFAEFHREITLAEVAELVNMSLSSFTRRFRQSTKKSYGDFLKEVRIGRACRLLAETNQSVLEIGFECGYNSAANFSRQFQELKGRSPLKYRKSLNNGPA